MNRCNLGKFELPYNTVVNHPEDTAELFIRLKLVPLRVEALASSDTIEYTALSDRFKEVITGHTIPRYNLILHSDDKGKIELVGVQEVK